jgi:hypothetical protein
MSVKALPEIMYRSFPETVQVQGKTDPDDPKKTITDWNLVEFVPEKDDPPPTPDQFNLRILSNEWHGGPVWLAQVIWDSLENMKKALSFKVGDLRARIRLTEPLIHRRSNQDDKNPENNLSKLISTYGKGSDPFGWRALESLGLSCEVVLEKADGHPTQNEEIYALLNDKGIPVLCKDVCVAMFLAEDGETMLNVIRLVCTPKAGLAPDDLEEMLRIRLCGSDNQLPPDILKNHDILSWLNSLLTRLNDVKMVESRLAIFKRTNSFHPDEKPKKSIRAAYVTLPVHAGGILKWDLPVPDFWAHKYLIAIERVRRYDLLWEKLTKPTDGSETASSDSVAAAGSLTEDLSQPSILGSSAIRISDLSPDVVQTVSVLRTQSLVPHNLISTPLPGSIQALVFAHPAHFAAAASAINAAHGQYSGQSVILKRRISPDGATLKELYKDVSNFKLADGSPTPNPFNWVGLDEWTGRVEGEEVPPALHDKEDLALRPVEGTQSGFYAADRYVYPDLPAYYEYEVAAYSTAGRVRSPLRQSGYCSPMYDQPILNEKGEVTKDARLQPRTIGFTDIKVDQGVSDDDLKLFFKIRVIHQRFHIRPKLRVLWRDSEELFEINEVGVCFGSLPDLYLMYQVRMLVPGTDQTKDNKDKAPPVGGGAANDSLKKIYRPFFQIAPGMHKGLKFEPEKEPYCFELIPQFLGGIPGVELILSSEILPVPKNDATHETIKKLEPGQRFKLTALQDPNTHEPYFRIGVKMPRPLGLDDEKLPDFIQQQFTLAVMRDGCSSYMRKLGEDDSEGRLQK